MNSIWTHLPQITQLCGLYCVEETIAKLAYCDSFFSSSDNAVLTSTRKEVRYNYETLTNVFVCLLVALRLSNMLVYLSDGSTQTIVRAATLRQNLQVKLSTSPSHSILTPGRLVPTLTLYRQAPGRVAAGVPFFKSLVLLDPEKSRRKRDSN